MVQLLEVREPGAIPEKAGGSGGQMERAIQRELPRVRVGRIHAHAVERAEAINLIIARAQGGLGGFVLTPNVDHVAIAQHSPALVDAYRRSFLSLADGMPIVLTSRLLRLPLRTKVSGSDVFEPLLARCAAERLPVFFLGSTADSCERAILMLKDRYPDIEITGYDDSMLRPRARPGHRGRTRCTALVPRAPGSSSARCRRPSRCCCRSSCGSTRRRSAWPRAARSASSSATSSGRRRGCRG